MNYECIFGRDRTDQYIARAGTAEFLYRYNEPGDGEKQKWQ